MGLVDDGPLCLLQPAMPVATLATGLTAEMLQLQGESYRDAQAAEDGDASDGSDGSDSPDSQHRDADKYKTELCRNWMQTGACPYNDRCQFAHGYVDMRVRKQPAAYKTRICRTFALTSTCPYGTKCRFIHAADPLQAELAAQGVGQGQLPPLPPAPLPPRRAGSAITITAATVASMAAPMPSWVRFWGRACG